MMTLNPNLNSFDMPLRTFLDLAFITDHQQFCHLYYQDHHLGYVLPQWQQQALQDAPHLFTQEQERLVLNNLPILELEEALQKLCHNWYQQGILPIFRNEKFNVRSPDGHILFTLERGAFLIFGLESQAIHLNGVTQNAEENLFWIGKRAAHKPTAPNKLDNLVSGGIGFNESPEQALIRESFEEAGLPSDLAKKAKSTGHFLSFRQVQWGLHREQLFVFDIELPSHFTPTNQDGEVALFEQYPPLALVKLILEGQFMKDAALVTLDALMRMGALGQTPQLTTWLNRARIKK
ncbi:NUDIX hydrolase [Neisseria sp. Ec49-e6-T10]|uniref:NUDIX hydrolase n=1 Tax=Neisseria sp. Ec49-e6-T10 TaxID=3140744 RepID=UPI003EBF83E8